MKCQYCNEHEATYTFLVSYSGGRQEIHLCGTCARMAQEHAETAKQMGLGLFAGAAAAERRKVGNIPFPDNAGASIRRQRRMNELKAKLEQAVAEERYEEAARLRDTIAAEEKDVYAV